MTEQEQSLRALFLEAKALKADVEENPDPTNESYQEKVATAIAKFEECQNLVSRASVFSTNEGLEDIATTDLQYGPVHLQTVCHWANETNPLILVTLRG